MSLKTYSSLLTWLGVFIFVELMVFMIVSYHQTSSEENPRYDLFDEKTRTTWCVFPKEGVIRCMDFAWFTEEEKFGLIIYNEGSGPALYMSDQDLVLKSHPEKLKDIEYFRDKARSYDLEPPIEYWFNKWKDKLKDERK